MLRGGGNSNNRLWWRREKRSASWNTATETSRPQHVAPVAPWRVQSCISMCICEINWLSLSLYKYKYGKYPSNLREIRSFLPLFLSF